MSVPVRAAFVFGSVSIAYVATGADEQLHRIGAICNDGSESGATGRGLVRVMATSDVGNTLMERATNF